MAQVARTVVALMLLPFVIALALLAWCAWWVGRITLMVVLVAVACTLYVVQGIALLLPRVAQWIERRLSEAEVARSTRAPRSYCHPECRDPWFNECADCWQSGGNPALGSPPTQRQGASGSTDTHQDGGTYA